MDVHRRAFTVDFSALEVWSVAGQFSAAWAWPPSSIKPLGDALVRRREPASDTLAPDAEVTMLTIRFDGTIEPRARVRLRDIKGRLFRVHPGDVVFSKIDVRNGAIGVAPDDIELICVSSEFPVYAVDVRKAEPAFVMLLLRTDAVKQILNSMISGASGRKRIQPSQLEMVRVPIPPPPIQRRIVSHWLTRSSLRRTLYSPLLPILGFVLSATGVGVETVWWYTNGFRWQNLYRFLLEGGVWLEWSVGLSLVGLILTGIHWKWGRRRWWSLIGGSASVLWLARITLGVLLVVLMWVWKQRGLDILRDLERSANRANRGRRKGRKG